MQAVYRTGIARTFFMDVKDLARKSWSVPYFPLWGSGLLETVVCPLFSEGDRQHHRHSLDPDGCLARFVAAMI